MKTNLSLILPLYNVMPYLTRCLESILKQTYSDYEVIMVDDCSTDGTYEAAQEFVLSHQERFKLFHHEQNQGLAAARNTGIVYAKGGWLTFLDSDDRIAPDFMRVMVETAEKDNADIVVADYAHVYEDGHEEPMGSLCGLTTESSQQEKIAFLRNMACCKLYRAEFFRGMGFLYPEHIRRAEDIPVTIPLLTRTSKISLVPQVLYYYFQRSSSLSNCNHLDTDLGFMEKTFGLMLERIAPGFETEIEYRAVQEFVYGMTSIMIQCGRTDAEIRTMLHEFGAKYPDWKKNPYLSRCVRGKQIFIQTAGMGLIPLLRLMISARKFMGKRFLR